MIPSASIQAWVCSEHSNFFRAHTSAQRNSAKSQESAEAGGKDGDQRSPTMDQRQRSKHGNWTATNSIPYTETRITPAAGIRFAMKWIFLERVKVDSFQLQDLKEVQYYFSPLLSQLVNR